MLQLREVPRAVLALHPVMTLMGLCTVRVALPHVLRAVRARVAAAARRVAARRRDGCGRGGAPAARRPAATRAGSVLGAARRRPGEAGRADRRRLGGRPLRGRDPAGRHRHARPTSSPRMPGSTTAQRRRAIELASATHLPVLTVPSIGELRDGGTRIERLRAIEPEDLLGRDAGASSTRPASPTLIRGRTVLVTGAGGSIGSELCRQIGASSAGAARAVRAERAQSLHRSTRRSPSAFPTCRSRG